MPEPFWMLPHCFGLKNNALTPFTSTRAHTYFHQSYLTVHTYCPYQMIIWDQCGIDFKIMFVGGGSFFLKQNTKRGTENLAPLTWCHPPLFLIISSVTDWTWNLLFTHQALLIPSLITPFIRWIHNLGNETVSIAEHMSCFYLSQLYLPSPVFKIHSYWFNPLPCVPFELAGSKFCYACHQDNYGPYRFGLLLM